MINNKMKAKNNERRSYLSCHFVLTSKICVHFLEHYLSKSKCACFRDRSSCLSFVLSFAIETVAEFDFVKLISKLKSLQLEKGQ